MKFLLSVAAIIAVATAIPTKRSLVSPVPAGPAILVDEHGQPISIGPTFIDGEIDFAPISIGPAIVGAGDIAVGPAIIDFPLPDGGAVSAPIEATPVVAPAPVAASESSPLVQIIVNVNAPASPTPVAEPLEIIDLMPVIDPVQIVDQVVDPVQVVETPVVVDPVQVVDIAPVVVDPVQVVDIAPVVVDPVQVVDIAPVVIDPIIIGTPILPVPAVNLPAELN